MEQFTFSMAKLMPDTSDGLLAENLVSTLASLASFDSWMLVKFSATGEPQILNFQDKLRSSEAYVNKFYMEDPFYCAICDGNLSDFISLPDIETRNFRNSRYFIEYLQAPLRFSDQVGYVCPVGAGEVYFLTLIRSENFKPFRSCEIYQFRKVAQMVRAFLTVTWIRNQTQSVPVVTNLNDKRELQMDKAIHDFGTTALSPREKEVLKLFLAGETAKTIGRALAISPGTAQCHIKKIYLKLGVSSRGELFGRVVDRLLEGKAA